jgi:hypothetical protein
MQQLDYNNVKGVISIWLLPRCCQEGTKLMSSEESCMGGCEDRPSARETEESPLLQAHARKRLVKTQQAGKDLACAGVICEFREKG